MTYRHRCKYDIWYIFSPWDSYTLKNNTCVVLNTCIYLRKQYLDASQCRLPFLLFSFHGWKWYIYFFVIISLHIWKMWVYSEFFIFLIWYIILKLIAFSLINSITENVFLRFQWKLPNKSFMDFFLYKNTFRGGIYIPCLESTPENDHEDRLIIQARSM